MINTKKRLIINYYLTFNCNLQCPYCFVYSNNKEKKGAVDKISLFLNYITEYFDFQAEIEFFGGEPLLRQNYIKTTMGRVNGYKFLITTNGLIPMSEFLLNKLDLINVSVHLFKKENILTYMNLFSMYKKYVSKISVILVIDKKNISFYYDLIKRLVELGYSKFLLLPVFLSYNWYGSDLKKLKDLAAFLKPLVSGFDTLDYSSNKRDINFSIDFSGNVYLFDGEFIFNKLLSNKFFIGNILEGNYKNIVSAVINQYDKYSTFSLKEYADYRYSLGYSFGQSKTNFIMLNKFLKYLNQLF